LELADLSINALLVRALRFTSAEEVIDFYVNLNVTIGAGTSWGQKALEKLCIIAGAKKVPKDENVEVRGKRFDLKKIRNGISYYIQLKSGPNTMNVGMVDSLNKMIEQIESNNGGKRGILGMTYGASPQISQQIRNNLEDFEDRAYIGQEFWQFLSGDREYYNKLIRLIDRLSSQFIGEYQRGFLQVVQNIKNKLEEEWRTRRARLNWLVKYS
jgi:hypothetical protein